MGEMCYDPNTEGYLLHDPGDNLKSLSTEKDALTINFNRLRNNAIAKFQSAALKREEVTAMDWVPQRSAIT